MPGLCLFGVGVLDRNKMAGTDINKIELDLWRLEPLWSLLGTSLVPRPLPPRKRTYNWFPLFMLARDNCENVRNRVSKCIREQS